MVEHGLEGFTFGKLARRIGTTESAVYRYFENKHKLLLYFVSWYWAWLDLRLVFATANLSDPEERLRSAIEAITRDVHSDGGAPFDLRDLQQLLVAEGPKAHLTKHVDDENSAGLFQPYKRITERLAKVLEAINPDYPHAHSLASLFLQAHLNQIYLAEHLPSLSNVGQRAETRFTFFYSLLTKALH